MFRPNSSGTTVMLGNKLTIGVLSLLLMTAATAPPPASAPTNWALTFSDEFNSLDLSRWDTQYAWGARHLGQGEMQVYVDPSYQGDTDEPLNLNPFSVQDGILSIQADKPDPDRVKHLQGQRYTSGLLTTYHSFSQLYGYFEMRARFPAGKGLWSAFWLLPKQISWPPEIDVVEALGDQTSTLFATVHMNDHQNKPTEQGFSPEVPDMTASFHRYGVLWTPEYVAWYFDGNQVAYTDTPKDMHAPMYLLVNLAVGGHWPGSPTRYTRFPAVLQIDYIKAYDLPVH